MSFYNLTFSSKVYPYRDTVNCLHSMQKNKNKNVSFLTSYLGRRETNTPRPPKVAPKGACDDTLGLIHTVSAIRWTANDAASYPGQSHPVLVWHDLREVLQSRDVFTAPRRLGGLVAPAVFNR